MVPTTKEMQRSELHKTIWRIANDLRGSVDGWDFKTYVLGMMFYRFISENLTDYINEGEWRAGDTDFNYCNLSNADARDIFEEMVAEKGFFIFPSDLFVNVRARAAQDENLNETLEGVFRNIEGSAAGTPSERDLKGLFADLDVNSPRLGATVAQRNQKLVKVLDAIGDLPLGSFEDNAIDLFGDAYEYLMQMYASQAGKSGGEYFTPQEVSEVLARIAVGDKKRIGKVYDPAVGSGSLLLKFAKLLGPENVKGFYGQEINLITYNLARINMFLHGINYEQFDIVLGDTLTNPMHRDKEPFEAIVSNPPYSTKWEGSDNPLLINDDRYAPAGVLAPKSKADLAFTMHILSSLATNGTAAVVEFPSVLDGLEDGFLGDLVEDHPLHRHLGFELVEQVPGDCLSLAVTIGGEVELVGLLEQPLELSNRRLLLRGHDVDRCELVIDVHTGARPRLPLVLRRDLGRARREVTDVPLAGPHDVLGSQISANHRRLVGRLNDDKALGGCHT